RVMVTEGSGLTRQYVDASVTGRVPGLSHGDFWLAESLAIIEYLEETFPPPEWPRILPADRQKRARARQIPAFMGWDLFSVTAERRGWTISSPGERKPLSPAARVQADELLGIVACVLREGSLEPWSIACADLAFGLLRLTRGGEVLAPELA